MLKSETIQKIKALVRDSMLYHFERCPKPNYTKEEVKPFIKSLNLEDYAEMSINKWKDGSLKEVSFIDSETRLTLSFDENERLLKMNMKHSYLPRWWE